MSSLSFVRPAPPVPYVPLTRDQMEQRRLEAAALLGNGLSQSRIARQFHVSRTTAGRWQQKLKAAGLDALRQHPAPGRPCLLTPDQWRELEALYRATRHTRWTCGRMVQVIEERFGVRYHPDHAGRILQRLRGPKKKKARSRGASA
jgi:transposase